MPANATPVPARNTTGNGHGLAKPTKRSVARTVPETVLEFLASRPGGVTAADAIAGLPKIKPRDVHAALYRMRKRGAVVVDGPKGNSRFSLPTKGGGG